MYVVLNAFIKWLIFSFMSKYNNLLHHVIYGSFISSHFYSCFDFDFFCVFFNHSIKQGEGNSLNHKVSDANNKLGVGKSFPGLSSQALNNVDLYAAEKEVYLGSLCEVDDKPKPWQFWMVMLKNGNYDTNSGLCPENGRKVPPFKPGRFPCPGNDCMNQPLLNHDMTSLSSDGSTMRGSFSGSYELGSQGGGLNSGNSYYEVVWEKKVGSGSWEFRHKLKTSKLYPWLMLYLRADATKGFSGGYHYDTRGMLKTVSSLRLTFEI